MTGLVSGILRTLTKTLSLGKKGLTYEEIVARTNVYLDQQKVGEYFRPSDLSREVLCEYRTETSVMLFIEAVVKTILGRKDFERVFILESPTGEKVIKDLNEALPEDEKYDCSFGYRKIAS